MGPPAALTKTMDQTEKAFQKQDAVFIGSKRLLGKKSKKAMRYWRNVGLGIKCPKEAQDGNYVDKKCPFTGNVSIRGTIVLRRNYLHYIKKYHRFEKRHKNLAVHCSRLSTLRKVILLLSANAGLLPKLSALTS